MYKIHKNLFYLIFICSISTIPANAADSALLTQPNSGEKNIAGIEIRYGSPYYRYDRRGKYYRHYRYPYYDYYYYDPYRYYYHRPGIYFRWRGGDDDWDRGHHRKWRHDRDGKDGGHRRHGGKKD